MIRWLLLPIVLDFTIHLNLGSIVEKQQREPKMGQAPVFYKKASFVNLNEHILKVPHQKEPMARLVSILDPVIVSPAAIEYDHAARSTTLHQEFVAGGLFQSV